MIGTGTMDTEAGRIRFATERDRLVALTFDEQWARHALMLGPDARQRPVSTPVAARLRDYFDGDLDALDRIQVAPEGTAFHQAVWAAMREISPGRTATYAELATRVGSPGAARAVGTACASNPIWIAVPCHRVVRTGGGLGGYGGGLDRKRWLLAHEQRHATVTAAAVG